MTPTVAVFDIGEVLVRWQPDLAWEEDFPNRDAAEAYMARIGFHAFNARADNGERFAQVALEIDDPQDRSLLAGYPERFGRTIREPIPESWALIERLQRRRVPLHAITNWAAETWDAATVVHPGLAEVFGTVIVSGVEKIMKPDPRIYRLLCERTGLRPEQCVFIDDKTKNVDGARSIGMDGIPFTDADALETELRSRGLL